MMLLDLFVSVKVLVSDQSRLRMTAALFGRVSLAQISLLFLVRLAE